MEDTVKGKMLIFTAPSGAGKTTVVRHLLDNFDELAFSVSATNRPIRKGEKDGVSYHFLSTQEFMDRVENDEFIEYEEVYPGRFYGTLHSEVDRIWAQGRAIVFDIEVKGATNLKRLYPGESMAVFVKPPNSDVLFKRLRDRSTETEEELQVRIARATEELAYVNNFDRVLVNDDLQVALSEAEDIVEEFLGVAAEKTSKSAMTIHPVTPATKPAVLRVAESCGLFQPEELGELAGMIDALIAGELEGHRWIALEEDGIVKGAAYYAPETFAEGVWNLYFIGVLADLQGKGHGSSVLRYIEEELRSEGQRILIIETSGLDGFELTRMFYDRHGYTVEARIRDYYQDGEDKVVFWKKLQRHGPE